MTLVILLPDGHIWVEVSPLLSKSIQINFAMDRRQLKFDAGFHESKSCD